MSEKTIVFSIGFNWFNIIFKECIQSHKDYCKRYGYTYKLIKKSFKELSSMESAWLKIPLVINALEAGYDKVFFIDADCLIRPHAPNLNELISKEKSIYLAPGFSGRINSGIIIVKNSKESLAFFKNILNNCETLVPNEDSAPYENGHMIHYGKNSQLVQMISHDLWNNNSFLDNNSYVQHFSNGKLRDEYLKHHKVRIFTVRLMNFIFSLNKRLKKEKKTEISLRESLLSLKKYHEFIATK